MSRFAAPITALCALLAGIGVSRPWYYWINKGDEGLGAATNEGRASATPGDQCYGLLRFGPTDVTVARSS